MAEIRPDHYGPKHYQHWDLVMDCWGPEYHLACAAKYVCRWREKGGLQDLHKAVTFLEKTSHNVDNVRYRHPEYALMKLRGMDLYEADRQVIRSILRVSSWATYLYARVKLKELIHANTPVPTHERVDTTVPVDIAEMAHDGEGSDRLGDVGSTSQGDGS